MASGTADQPRRICLDLGNGFSKYYSSTFEGYFPSVYAMQEPGIDFEGLATSKDLVIEMEDCNKYAVGWSAWKLGNIPVRTLDRSRINSPDYRILFAAALVASCRQSGTIAPILSLPVLWYDRKEDVRKFLAGEWRVKVAGKQLTFTIPSEYIRLIPEGFGSLCSMILDKDGRVVSDELAKMKVGIVDVGTLTTDLLLFDKLEFVPSRTTGDDSLGLNRVYQIMKQSAAKQGYRSFSIEELDAVLNHQPLFNGSEQISDKANTWKVQALQQVANAVAGLIKSSWKGGNEVQRLLLTGGGAEHLHPYLIKHFPDHLIPVKNGPMANVIGGYAYGKLKGF